MSDHPELAQLLTLASGDQGDVTADEAAHVAGCALCAETVARYRLVAATLQNDDAPAPSHAALTRAKALFSVQPRAEAPDILAPLRRIIAELVFDSGGMTPQLAGFRGGGDRHLTFVVDAVQIDLRLQPPVDLEGSWHIHGQLDADDLLPVATVDLVLTREDLAVVRTETDEVGMFSLAAPAGRYDILVRLPDLIQVLPGLDLG